MRKDKLRRRICKLELAVLDGRKRERKLKRKLAGMSILSWSSENLLQAGLTDEPWIDVSDGLPTQREQTNWSTLAVVEVKVKARPDGKGFLWRDSWYRHMDEALHNVTHWRYPKEEN